MYILYQKRCSGTSSEIITLENYFVGSQKWFIRTADTSISIFTTEYNMHMWRIPRKGTLGRKNQKSGSCRFWWLWSLPKRLCNQKSSISKKSCRPFFFCVNFASAVIPLARSWNSRVGVNLSRFGQSRFGRENALTQEEAKPRKCPNTQIVESLMKS